MTIGYVGMVPVMAVQSQRQKLRDSLVFFNIKYIGGEGRYSGQWAAIKTDPRKSEKGRQVPTAEHADSVNMVEEVERKTLDTTGDGFQDKC